MSLTAERVALADQAIQRAFAQCCITWQTVPQWDAGDPGRTKVGTEVRYSFGANFDATKPFAMDATDVVTKTSPFAVTAAQAAATTPDAVLTAALARAPDLARQVDEDVLPQLAIVPAGNAAAAWRQALDPNAVDQQNNPAPPPPQDILDRILDARQALEDSGFRAPSCLVASSAHFRLVNRLDDNDIFVGPGLLLTASVDTLVRSSALNPVAAQPNVAPAPSRMLMLGRTCEIPPGGAAAASAGEEPVDIAVCVPPSLEVIGEDGSGNIGLALRVRYALRIKDPRGVVSFR